MAELSERLQPSLLDRLTDNDPTNQNESREQRVMSLDQIRAAVQRDLAWLMNATALSTTQDLDDFPEVASSVLNFGIRDLAGMTLEGADTVSMEKVLHEAICRFEPRILSHSLHVRVTADSKKMNSRALVMEIEGILWAQPSPLRLLWNTELDLETGAVVVREKGR